MKTDTSSDDSGVKHLELAPNDCKPHFPGHYEAVLVFMLFLSVRIPRKVGVTETSCGGSLISKIAPPLVCVGQGAPSYDTSQAVRLLTPEPSGGLLGLGHSHTNIEAMVGWGEVVLKAEKQDKATGIGIS